MTSTIHRIAASTVAVFAACLLTFPAAGQTDPRETRPGQSDATVPPAGPFAPRPPADDPAADAPAPEPFGAPDAAPGPFSGRGATPDLLAATAAPNPLSGGGATSEPLSRSDARSGPLSGSDATSDPSSRSDATDVAATDTPATPRPLLPRAAAASPPRTLAPAPTPPAPATAATPSTPPTPAADPEALSRAYRRTGAAPTVEIADQGRGAVSLVPFGHGKPILRCAPLRACGVELEPGELVLATSLGDAERWLVQSAVAGPGARTPLLVVKPTACDLSTNLVVATDRRIYELALDSPPCHNADLGAGGASGAAGAAGATGEGAYNPRLPYTGLIRFYYPDDLVHRWIDQEARAREDETARTAAAAGSTPLAPAARLAHLNFDYSWDRARRWPWVPAQIFDDGEHTYLVLPPAARLAELPILLAVEPGGGLALLTYRLEDQTLVADRVLDHAVLLVGHGRPKDEQRLEITNRALASSRNRHAQSHPAASGQPASVAQAASAASAAQAASLASAASAASAAPAAPAAPAAQGDSAAAARGGVGGRAAGQRRGAEQVPRQGFRSQAGGAEESAGQRDVEASH